MLVTLLRTKLDIPSPRPTLVPRSRLTERLAAGMATRLSLVVAPAGFGKTTLVGEWIAGLHHPGEPVRRAGWLTLDEADNEPFRFAAHLIAALQAVEPALGEAVQALLGGTRLPPAETLITALINDLAAHPARILLVLDDYHVIRSEWVHTALSFLLDHQPSSLHLVLIAREDPPLPLPRLRVRGQLTEIRAHDLRFTLDETVTFLNQAMGLSLTAQAAAALETRTEGWIAGLQLAALALQQHPDVDSFIQAFSGSHHYVIDYLVDEVLRRQAPQVRTFLVQTSVLDRFCASLCKAVVDDSAAPGEPGTRLDTQAMLAYLEQANLFLVPLDDRRHWFRYHHLFADSLRAELDPSQEAALHRRAAQWFSENDLLPEAIRHAQTAHDHDLAADLLARAGQEPSLWSGGDFRRYLAWVEALPLDLIHGRPRLQLCYSRALYLFGRVSQAERVLDAVDEQLRAAPTPDQNLMAISAAYRAQCTLERGDFQTTRQLAEYAIAHLAPEAEPERARATYALASAHYAQGQMDTAGSLFEQASQAAERKGALSLALSSGECAARCLALQGRLDAARLKSEQVLALGQLGRTRHPLSVGALLTLAEIAYQQNDLDRVEPLLSEAIELAETLGTLVRAQQCWAYQQLARLRRARGDLAGAAQAIEQADVVAREVDNGFYLHAMANRRDPVRCDTLTLQERVYMPTLFYALQESDALTTACKQIAQQRPQEALPILDRLLDAAQQGGRGLAVIELQLWRALAFQSLRHDDPALKALEQALALAAPQHCLRPFLDAGQAVNRLLQKAVYRDIRTSLSRPLLEMFALETASSLSEGQVQPPVPAAHAMPLLEPLSARELDVLRLIADGLSNKEIADRLFIGVGTVKWYATTIYSKLDVGSRTQAVARAQELGLIP